MLHNICLYSMTNLINMSILLMYHFIHLTEFNKKKTLKLNDWKRTASCIVRLHCPKFYNSSTHVTSAGTVGKAVNKNHFV